MSDTGTTQTAVMEQCVMASYTDARMKEHNFTAGFFPTSKEGNSHYLQFSSYSVATGINCVWSQMPQCLHWYSEKGFILLYLHALQAAGEEKQ